MAPTKKLSTLVAQEGKFVAMTPGRISLRPETTRTVQLADGTYSQIDVPPLEYECEGENRNGRIGRMLDPSIPRDKEILDAFEQLLIDKPYMATDVRYNIEIIGEYTPMEPWKGYSEQGAEAVRETYTHLPDAARPALEQVMKFELEHKEWDEDLEEYVSLTDEDKIKVLNELYKEAEKAGKVASDDKVDLV